LDIAEFEKFRYMNFATFRKSGVEVKTPVWFTVVDGKIYLYSRTDSGKAKRLRNSPRARIAPSTVNGTVKGEWRDTNARIVADPALALRVYAAMRKKYGFQIAFLTLLTKIAGKMDQRVYVEVDYPK
jgi:PPOX class probable F420-dependent enzyme